MKNVLKVAGVFSLLVVVILGTSGIVKADDVKWVTISGAVDRTSHHSLTVAPSDWALIDYFKELNLTGGFTIKGQKYKVKVLTGDSQQKVEKSLSFYRKFVENGSVFHHIEGSGESEAIKELAKRLKVPVMAGGSTKKAVFPAGMVFCRSSLYPNYNGTMLKWYSEVAWPKKGKNRAPRLAFLIWGIPFGKEAVVPDQLEYLKKELGYEVVGIQEFSPVSTTVDPQLRVLKKAKPDIIFLQCLGSSSTTVILEAKRLGMTPPKIDWMGPAWAIGQAQLKELGDASEGMYGGTYYYFNTVDDTPQLRAMRSAWVRYRKGTLYNSILLYGDGWSMAVQVEHCIKEAIKKHGYPITGEMMYDELVRLHNFETGVQSTIDYAYQGRQSCTKLRVYKIHNQDEEVVSDWLTFDPKLFKYSPYLFSNKKWWGTETNKLPENVAKKNWKR